MLVQTLNSVHCSAIGEREKERDGKERDGKRERERVSVSVYCPHNLTTG